MDVQSGVEKAISNLGLSQWLRPNTEDGQVLDDLTVAYIHRKLELRDPEEARLEGITQLVQLAKEKVALSKQHLEQSHESVNKTLERLHTFTQAPAGWFMDLCNRQNEIVLQLHRTFRADDSCDEVRTAAGEVLFLHLCVDELHVPPRLVVREIQAKKDASADTGQLEPLPPTTSRSGVPDVGGAVVTDIKEKSQASSATAFLPAWKESNSSAPETVSSRRELTPSLSSSSGAATTTTTSETLRASATSLSLRPPAYLATTASSQFYLPQNTFKRESCQPDASSQKYGDRSTLSFSRLKVKVRYDHENKQENHYPVPVSSLDTKASRSSNHHCQTPSHSACAELASERPLTPSSSRNSIKKHGEGIKCNKSRCDLAATHSRQSIGSTSNPSSTTTGRYCYSTMSFHDSFSDDASEISRLGTASSSVSLPQFDPLRFSSLQIPDLILGKDKSHNAVRRASVTRATPHQQPPKANHIDYFRKKRAANEKIKPLGILEQLHVDAETSASRNDARFRVFEKHPHLHKEQNPLVLLQQEKLRNTDFATHVAENGTATMKNNTGKTKRRDSLEKGVDLRIIRVSKEALMPERNERRVLISGHYQRKDNQQPLRFMLFVYIEEESQAVVLDQSRATEGNKCTSSAPDKTVLCGSYVRDMLTNGKRLRWRFRQPAEEVWGVVL